MTTADIVRFVIDTFEGHLFTDDPVDTGGATKYGITRRTLAYYRGRAVTKQEVRDLTLDEAVACGVQVFAVEPHIDRIPDWRVRLSVYDYGFHSGQPRAIKALQAALNADRSRPALAVDGRLGPSTFAALDLVSALPLALTVLTAREEFMQDIMKRKPSQRRFLYGWWIRTTKLQRQVLA